MRVVRPALCIALATSVAVTGYANAAKRPKPKPVPPVCNLLIGDAGDAAPAYTLGAPVNPAGSDDALDILSADVASNATTLTAVLRIKDLSASSTTGTTGRSYVVLFTLPGGTGSAFLGYQTDASGAYADYGDVEFDPTGLLVFSDVGHGNATATVDKAKNEIHISVPITALAAFGNAKPGAKITNLEAQTSATYGQPDALGNPYLPSPAAFALPVAWGFSADDDKGTKQYVAGTPSCVKPGS